MNNNKKEIAITTFIVAIIILGAYAFGLFQGLEFDDSSVYTAPAAVSEINESTGWITLVDWRGEAWCIRGDGYELNQLVIVVFNDNATEDIYDDLIVEVKCATNIEEVI